MSRRPPEPLPRLYRWRTNLIQIPAGAVITAICGSLSLFVSLFDKRGLVQHRIARVWARSLVWCSGCSLEIRGAENLRKHPVAVYAANHTSYMDTPVIFAALPFQFRILAKKELWPMAFIGWYLARSGQIPIDTVNTHATLSSLGAGVKALRGGNAALCVSGGRPHVDRGDATLSCGGGISGHSRAGASRSHCAERCLRSPAHPHAPLLSGNVDLNRGRADFHRRPHSAPHGRADGAASWGY